MMQDVMNVELGLARKIFWLLLHDHVFLTSYNSDIKTWDDGAYPAINCNDLFVPGADAESLSAEDIDLYIEVVKKFPDVGSYAWCGVKRAAKPWRMSGSEWERKYQEALVVVEKMMKGKT